MRCVFSRFFLLLRSYNLTASPDQHPLNLDLPDFSPLGLDSMGLNKAPQACEICRSLKVRCLPSSQPDTCLKCARSKKPCVFVERPPRQRQAKPKHGSKARICALESKVDDLIALASQSQLHKQQNFPQGIAELSELELLTSSSSSTRGEQESTRNDQNRCTGSNLLTGSFDDWSGHSKPNGSFCTELLRECGISLDAAEGYVGQFHKMTSYFPFVVLPIDATVSNLCTERPFALVAALTAAASEDRKLQKSLGDKFRIRALHAIMIDNDRSLDLLNGILIYLAWYQFHYVPSKEQFNQLLHVAIAMVGDLGLNLRPAEAMKKAALRLAHYRKFRNPTANHDEFFSREARRAYLGCFYISSITCWATMKTNNLQFQSYMVECATSLGEELEYPTDAILLPLIQLQNMAELNHQSITADDSTILDYMGGLDLETKVRSFQDELSKWKQSLPLACQQPNVKDVIHLACELAAMHVFEMGVVMMATVKMRQMANYAEPTISPSKSQVHLEVLFLCLKSAGNFAGTLLTIPPYELTNISYIQWSGLIYAITIIYRLTVGIPHLPDWDVRVARKTIDFEAILIGHSCRFGHYSFCTQKIPGDEYLFSMMSPIIEDVLMSYERLRQLPQKDSADDTRQVHATSYLSSSLGSQNMCPMLSSRGPNRLT
ncbi:unnamed protein product [Penicillium salamii]|uniref:Zn(2)-C6 fungal-type domain-containing protein n=1 Tax=Penicillium salamii TaxID=1612424 RepID=A0A9W4JWE0_9EURO|nr:unnamed protein product [Penicillium salamii]